MHSPRIAVIMFPGTNCEEESAHAVESVGMQVSILRWNTKESLDNYDGFILPGGFSYEDRIRAGIIAAQEPIMKNIKSQSNKGKPIIGICNGAQILVEAGIIPGLKNRVEIALAPNENPFISGYYCTWVHIKSVGNCAFNKLFESEEVIPIPIAHAEGRFVTKDSSLLNQLKKNKQISFQYCDEQGNIIERFPINPNETTLNIAGISNKEGNVLAIMPHPERASFKRQIPNIRLQDFEDAESNAPAVKIFDSMKKYILANFSHRKI
mgnify:CR=1 FL=1